MVGSRSWIGGLLYRAANKRQGSEKNQDYILTPLQEERVQKLQERLNVPFDETRPDHQEALRALWNAAFPDTDLKGLISDQWKDMGWQGSNPSTDFRGCGFISLENLLFFARKYPAAFQRLLFKQGGQRATWEYPFAVAGINVSFMLIQMLDLYSAKPKSLPGINFLKILSRDEEAFDILYCIAFEMMDAQWLAMRASYMEFNEVLQVTRTQLERELSLEDVHRIQDVPAYNLLYHSLNKMGSQHQKCCASLSKIGSQHQKCCTCLSNMGSQHQKCCTCLNKMGAEELAVPPDQGTSGVASNWFHVTVG